jgi:hypothetical protein
MPANRREHSPDLFEGRNSCGLSSFLCSGENADDAIVRNICIFSKAKPQDAIPIFQFFHAHVREDLTRGRIARGFAVVGMKVASGFGYVFPEQESQECVLYALGLNSATEHEVGHPGLVAIHDAESDNAIAAEAICAT